MKESNIYRTIKFEDNKVKYNDVTSANENYTAYDQDFCDLILEYKNLGIEEIHYKRSIIGFDLAS